MKRLPAQIKTSLARVARAAPAEVHALCLVAVLLARCAAFDPDPVILQLGEQVVRRSEFEHHLEALEKRGGATLDPGVRQALLQPFLEERVQVLEVIGRGWLAPGASLEAEQDATRRLLDAEVLAKLEVTPAEAEVYYGQHAGELAVPERLRLRQILVPTEAEAIEVRERLARDPQSFEGLAQTRSRGPEASTGGLMGSFARGELPLELEQAALALAPGRTSEIVKTPLGFHILKLDARAPARAATLEEAQEEIHAKLLREKSDAAVRQFVQGLLARAKVNDAVVNP